MGQHGCSRRQTQRSCTSGVANATWLSANHGARWPHRLRLAPSSGSSTPQTWRAQPLRSSLAFCNCFPHDCPICGPRSLQRQCRRRSLCLGVLLSRRRSRKSQKARMNTTTFSGRTPRSHTEHGEWLLSRHIQRYDQYHVNLANSMLIGYR